MILENQQLKRLEVQNNKLKEELQAVKNENKDLGEILKDKEELTRTVELLIEENRRYKTHQVSHFLVERIRGSFFRLGRDAKSIGCCQISCSFTQGTTGRNDDGTYNGTTGKFKIPTFI